MKKFLLGFMIFLLGCGSATATPVPAEVSVVETAVIAPLPTNPPVPTDLPTATLAPPVIVAAETATPEPIIVETAVITPTEPIPPTVAPIPEAIIEVDDITLPAGFSIRKFADIERPTGLAFDNAGNLLVTTQDGLVMAYQDNDGDGHADVESQFSFGFVEPLGVAVHASGDVYISSTAKISVLRDLDGDLIADEATNFVRDLPYDRHKNNNLKFGPDGLLYMGVGSTCDVCYEVDSRSATIMRWDVTNPNSGEVFATGLRNPFDIAFQPETGALFGTDNGRDDLGSLEPSEELNHIVQGGNYGFPDCWDEGKGSGCEGTITAVSFFEPRSSVNSLEFYTGNQFPAEYHNNLFVSVFGSWVNDEIKRGIWRVQLTPAGETYTTTQSWFAEWPEHWLLGMTMGPDGALYIGDIFGDAIYRISYGN